MLRLQCRAFIHIRKEILIPHVSSTPTVCDCRFIPTAYYYPDAALTPATVNSDYFPAMGVSHPPPPPHPCILMRSTKATS